MIDIRASFTSFVPADLPSELAHQLVDCEIAGLRSRPELHDKVELELVFHCWTFDLVDRLAQLSARHNFESAACEMLERRCTPSP